jgi:uncharacterized protein (DUF58 family)
MIEVEFLDELERYNLMLKKRSEEVRQGEQASEHTGQGMVFKDHKQYVPGDDIRRIDWKAYARTKDYFVKRFEEERSLTLHILVDKSSSMDFGNPQKYDYAAKIGLAIAYMAANTDDRFRYSVFSETLTDISSGRSSGNFGQVVDTLNSMRKTPESRIERCITEYSSRIKNKSAVIIISDFLTDLDEIESAVANLQPTETILVNVFAHEELEPDYEGDTVLMDPESDSRLRTYLSRKTKSSYREKLENHTRKIQQICDGHGAEYVKASTGDDVFNTFLDTWQALNR